MLLAGLVGQAAGSLAGSVSNGPALLLASRILEGLGFICVGVSAPALIFRVTPPAALRTALSLWSCYVPAGIAAIMALTPLLSLAFGWRGLWQANAAVALAYAGAVAVSTRKLADRPARREIRLQPLWQDVRAVSTSPAPLRLAFIFTAYALLWLAVMGFMPTLFVDAYGVVPGHAAYLTALMVGVNVPGNLAGGALLQRGVRRSRLIAAALVIMGACTLGIYAPSLPFALRYLACLAFSAFGGMLPASIMSAVPLLAPRPALVGTANGLIVQGSHLGQLIGPPVLALIVSATGSWQSAPWFLAGAALAGALLSARLSQSENRPPGS
jgi:MFS family permease